MDLGLVSLQYTKVCRELQTFLFRTVPLTSRSCKVAKLCLHILSNLEPETKDVGVGLNKSASIPPELEAMHRARRGPKLGKNCE